MDVSFQYGQGSEPLRSIAEQKVTFGTADPDALLLAASQGLPLVAIFQTYQKNPVGAFCILKSHDACFKSWKNKRVGLPALYGSSLLAWNLVKKEAPGAQESRMQVIGFQQVAALLAGKVDIAFGYLNHEPLILQKQKKQVFFVQLDHFRALPGNVIVTSQSLLKQNPELVHHFLLALQRGFKETMENPADALQKTRATYLSFVKTPQQEKDELDVLKTTFSYWKENASKEVGTFTIKKWENLHNVLKEQKVLTKDVTLKDIIYEAPK